MPPTPPRDEPTPAAARPIVVLRRKSNPLPAIYARHTDEDKQAAVEEYFGGAGPWHGKLRFVAIKHQIKESTFQGWVAGHDNALACLAACLGRRAGAQTVLPKDCEDAIAAVVEQCYRQNRCINSLQLLAIATDTAEKHGVVWQARGWQVSLRCVFAVFWVAADASCVRRTSMGVRPRTGYTASVSAIS